MPSHYWIGTSGWDYRHWRGPFYPKEMPAARWLDFFCRHFKTVELNNTFYRLPKEETWRKWGKSVPEGFVFSVKASRFITHVKRLKDCEEPLETFLGRARLLGDALGPVLYQLPPNFQRTPANVERVADFLAMLPQDVRHVFEFRHESWFTDEVFALLSRHNAGFCAFHMADRETPLEATTDFAYIRFHGGDSVYGGSYSEEQLANWEGRIQELPEDVRDAYIYFNNDAEGHAVANANTMIFLLTPFAVNHAEEKAPEATDTPSPAPPASE